ncbi:MAG: hypothetical protein AUK24_02475 [Syntrophaceae bacterium CG2_30_49_12]|nr:MAG: hypothetical protein AUK24_02475 [Syntrophaceae bacterium CG2_30_49_12]PIP05359.1 MAG: hypothetical protein COX52_12385 [Syntrophobacterales bacterium CG23_combo_of_CG06-09_8_20_14_all_48_27]PJA47521.1 MAG: hypothetical protein CO171_09540 [Syntrophobacterales bacterium CG_4_9_14_3_um_filter_49_8]PJC77168.1 MAG: hypothetical protein CO012_00020 [Syntrophobacterales bacterium CG_4_8_14_3_um_filter_49_14]
MKEKQAMVLIAEGISGADGLLRDLLEQRNLEVLECSDGIEAVRITLKEQPDIAILDTTLPRLNGYQVARILRNDPVGSSTSIFHIGASINPVERYWSKLCGGDEYLQRPVQEGEIEVLLRRFLPRKGARRGLLAPVSPIPNLDDHAIMALVVSLLEKDLLRANILNEINIIDVFYTSTQELVAGAMAIVRSLFQFSLGAALLVFDHHGEFFFYRNARVEEARLGKMRRLILEHLRRQNDIYLQQEEIREYSLQSDLLVEDGSETDEVYVHVKEATPVRAVLAFENIGFENLECYEQRLLLLALDLVQGMLEKKMFLEMVQELSIIDTVTTGHSMTFFTACLEREIENAKRVGYPMTVFSVGISNLKEIAKELGMNQGHRIIYDVILKTLRKADIVARREMTTYVFLLTHTPREKAIIVQDRVRDRIREGLTAYLSPLPELVIEMGIRQYQTEQDVTPELFLANMEPRNRDD